MMRSAILLALALSVSSAAQVSSSQIDAIFAPLKSSNAPGGAVLVVRNGKPVFRQGYGVTDLRTLHPIDAQTNFRLASFHQAVHCDVHHASRARRQAAL